VEFSGKLIEQKLRHRRKGTSAPRKTLHYLLRENKPNSAFAHAESARYGFSAKRYTTKTGYRQKVLCSSLFNHRNQTFTVRNTCMESV